MNIQNVLFFRCAEDNVIWASRFMREELPEEYLPYGSGQGQNIPLHVNAIKPEGDSQRGRIHIGIGSSQYLNLSRGEINIPLGARDMKVHSIDPIIQEWLQAERQQAQRAYCGSVRLRDGTELKLVESDRDAEDRRKTLPKEGASSVLGVSFDIKDASIRIYRGTLPAEYYRI